MHNVSSPDVANIRPFTVPVSDAGYACAVTDSPIVRMAKVVEKAKVTVVDFVGTVSVECLVRAYKHNSQSTELQALPSRSNPAQKMCFR